MLLHSSASTIIFFSLVRIFRAVISQVCGIPLLIEFIIDTLFFLYLNNGLITDLLSHINAVNNIKLISVL